MSNLRIFWIIWCSFWALFWLFSWWFTAFLGPVLVLPSLLAILIPVGSPPRDAMPYRQSKPTTNDVEDYYKRMEDRRTGKGE